MATTTRQLQREQTIALIRSTAEAAGLPPAVALATAEVEANFNPNAEGDLKWHERKGGELYRKNVRDNPRFSSNPARLVPELWHSYGLFQLMAAYQAENNEHPHALRDPHTNTVRGVRMLKRLYDHYDGDVAKVRVHYGAGSQNVSDATRAKLLSRFMPAYERWSRDPGGDDPPPSPPSGRSGLVACVVIGVLWFLSRMKA